MDIEKAIDCLKADKEYLTDMKICDGEEMDIAIKALEEIQQYRAIGIVEECRAAVDKMKPKKTAIEAIKVHICPVCGFGGIYDYCGNCGQRVQMFSD